MGMTSKFHLANGRGYEQTHCCLCCSSFRRCSTVHICILAALFGCALIVAMLVPSLDPVVRIIACVFFTIALLSAFVAQVGVVKQAAAYLVPLLAVMALVSTVVLTVLITGALMPLTPYSRRAFDSGDEFSERYVAFFPKFIVHFLIGPPKDGKYSLDRDQFITVYAAGLMVLFAAFVYVIHATLVLCGLWRNIIDQYDVEGDATLEWMFSRFGPISADETTTAGRPVPPMQPRYEERQWRRSTYISIDDGLDDIY